MKQLKIINKSLIGLIVILIFFFLVGITYSYFLADITGSETETTLISESGKLDIVFDGGPTITSAGFFPSSEPFATKNFTVTGTSTAEEGFIGYRLLLIIDENTFSTGAISYTLTSTTSGNGQPLQSTEDYKSLYTFSGYLGTGFFEGIAAGATHNYSLKFYFLDTDTDQTADMEKSIKAHVQIEKYIDPCNYQECPGLGGAILAQGDGAAAIEAKGTPDFSVINGTSGLYAADDNYTVNGHKSYYYRGKKSELNNNLIWGGFQWKIVRINGDGSVRLVYNGTELQFNTNKTVNVNGTDTQLTGTHAWNETNRNDNKYLGYMYGGANGVASKSCNGSISTAATYNETDTNIKTVLDTWYNTNISGKPFASEVVDNLFCNDRSKSSGLGYGTYTTSYAAYNRLPQTPTLMCGQQNDQFTTSVDSEIGNGNLTNPVGLLSADEAAMAGLVDYQENSTNYLYTNQEWWSLSPSGMYSNGIAYVWYGCSCGGLHEGYVDYPFPVCGRQFPSTPTSK